MRRNSESAIPNSGRGGWTIIELLICTAIISVLIGLLLPAIQFCRQAAWRAQCHNNFRQISLAFQHRQELSPAFPINFPLPWPLDALPFAENQAIPAAMAADLQRGGTAREQLGRQPLPMLWCPADERLENLGLPAVNIGFNPALLGRRPDDCIDGTSNTLCLGELPSSLEFPWIAGPLIYPEGLGSRHPGNWTTALLDGSVRGISKQIHPQLLNALLTMDGGEVVGEVP